MKKDIRLLALDLDGTLLNNKKEISELNRQAIQSARKNGVHVVLTTGRPLLGIQPYLDVLKTRSADEFSITYNGGLIQRNDGSILSKKTLNLTEALDIKALTDELGIPCDILSEEEVFETDSPRPSLYHTINTYMHFQKRNLDEMTEETVINKIVASTDQEVLDEKIPEIPAIYKEKLEIFKTQAKILEFMPQGVNKAYGLAELCKTLGLTAEQVAACGDEENDLSMIGWAGTGVAMKNASDEVKASADVILDKTNDEDGIAQFIEDYIL
ncbi:Cof-type HAD-IIB family hydrolase [Lactococcus termiticola]|uniref:Haloacid dehalogenase n=1 Tax=Lactococcus termiticola TaxID=2169526 RepID=A0A2R5HE34_9LACT|nr:Cof-type HAD-IIB family hydrolase [Lactococcus termiticola]GBG96337.1 haloacid dehalogenase [Lactococcus termiticola]